VVYHNKANIELWSFDLPNGSTEILDDSYFSGPLDTEGSVLTMYDEDEFAKSNTDSSLEGGILVNRFKNLLKNLFTACTRFISPTPRSAYLKLTLDADRSPGRFFYSFFFY
jgi:hypothetical protein